MNPGVQAAHTAALPFRDTGFWDTAGSSVRYKPERNRRHEIPVAGHMDSGAASETEADLPPESDTADTVVGPAGSDTNSELAMSEAGT
jgi:hypothetical protein